jgi:phage terminase large subunit
VVLKKHYKLQKEFKILQPYAPLFWSDKTYFLISGGRASGKSTQAAAYFLMKLMGDDFFRGVVARYTQKSIKSSIYRDILDLADAWGLKPFIRLDGDEIINIGNGNMILTHAMRLSDGSMSAKGKGLSKVTHLLIDEATELPSEEEFIKLNDSFRTPGVDRKILILFNPTSTRHWIHRRWYIDSKPNPKWAGDHEFIHTTYHINQHNLDEKKIREWEGMQLLDEDYYRHHILGEWSDGVMGRIFKDWIMEYQPDQEAKTLYGLDFGFSQDPTTLVEVKKHGRRIWLKELIYEKGLTNQDLHAIMQSLGVPATARIIADSAEPKSIEELRRLGWRNISGAAKGPDSIRKGIDTVKSHIVHLDPHSTNLIDEYNLYSWDRTGQRPEDQNNHCMDAIRYALSQEGGNSQYGFYSKKQERFDEEGQPLTKPQGSLYGYK